MTPQPQLSWVERLEPALLLSAVAAGLALARATPRASEAAQHALTPALVVLLVAVFYRVSLGRLGAALGHRRYFAVALGVNFLFTPLVAFGLGWLFLRDEPALWLGLVLVLVAPCTDWYLVFTALARGDVALNLALLPWNLLFQLALLPVYLAFFTQRLVPVELSLVGRTMLLYVVVPLGVGQGLRRLWRGERAEEAMVLVQYGALVTLIVALFANQGEVLFARPLVLLRLVPPVALFFVLLAGTSVLVGHRAAFSAPTRASLACTACARNSPLTLSLALMLFPTVPLVALSQVVEPLVELPLLILLAAWLRRSA